MSDNREPVIDNDPENRHVLFTGKGEGEVVVDGVVYDVTPGVIYVESPEHAQALAEHIERKVS